MPWEVYGLTQPAPLLARIEEEPPRAGGRVVPAPEPVPAARDVVLSGNGHGHPGARLRVWPL
ncbi:MAG: hypothetical protein ACRDKW_14280 [Actinomycetota bacterium]